jgi:hypothetical protein
MKKNYKNIVNNYNNIMNFQNKPRAKNSHKSFMTFQDEQSMAYREAIKIFRYKNKKITIFAFLLGTAFYLVLLFLFTQSKEPFFEDNNYGYWGNYLIYNFFLMFFYLPLSLTVLFIIRLIALKMFFKERPYTGFEDSKCWLINYFLIEMISCTLFIMQLLNFVLLIFYSR